MLEAAARLLLVHVIARLLSIHAAAGGTVGGSSLVSPLELLAVLIVPLRLAAPLVAAAGSLYSRLMAFAPLVAAVPRLALPGPALFLTALLGLPPVLSLLAATVAALSLLDVV